MPKHRFFYLLSFATLGIVSIWLIGSTVILIAAPKLIFETDKQSAVRPNVPNLEEVYTTDSRNQQLEMWFTDNPKSDNIVLYLHGNIGRLPEFMPELGKNFDVLAPAYHGYGKSQGTADTNKLNEASNLAYLYLLERGYQPQNITVWGHSLGGSPALYLATKYPDLHKVVLVNTFYSAKSMCERQYSIFCGFSGDILNNAKLAQKTLAPIRQYHNQNDERVPYAEGLRLSKEISSPDFKFETITGSHSMFDIQNTLK